MALTPDYYEGNYVTEVDDTALVAIVRNLTTGKVVKRFTGELAWSDAQRKASDLALADMYG
jgi:hypothetical protein